MPNINDLNLHIYNGSGYTERLLELVSEISNSSQNQLATTSAIETYLGTEINSIGSDTQIIFNSGETLTGSSNLTYNGEHLTVGNQPTISTSSGNRIVNQDFGRYYTDSQVLRGGEAHFENLKIQNNFGIDSGSSYMVAIDSNSTNHLRFGIGVSNSGELEFVRKVEITDTTTSTSINTGALTVSGGVGIVEDLWIGNNTYINGSVSRDSGEAILQVNNSGQFGDEIENNADFNNMGSSGINAGISVYRTNSGNNKSSGIFSLMESSGGESLKVGIFGVGRRTAEYNSGDGNLKLIGVCGTIDDLETNFNFAKIGVLGIDSSSASSAVPIDSSRNSYGVYAKATQTNMDGDNYGIYASVEDSGTGTYWAGYFDGPVNINGSLNSKYPVKIVTGSTTLTRENSKVIKQKTNSGITTTLWSSEEEGDNVIVINRTGYDTIVSGSTIEGSSSFTLTNGESINLVYIDSEWLIY